MKQIMSKSRLAIILSGLEGFYKPKVRQEQYLMDSEIGASVIWNAFLLGDIEKMTIADLGCGTGILGIGALLIGAKNVLFIDSDEKSLKIAENNISKVKSEGYVLGSTEFICQDIGKLEIKADVVLQNPPFGTKVRHNDIFFLKSAMKIASIVYSFHKSETKEFLQRFSAKNDSKITHIWDFRFPLKATFSFHRRQIHRVNVSCLRFEKLFK
ncbi:50S ribosomal protein L11 methyltransferase [Candidatus Woesearchaeota archaeon]|nr:50S ribosomal protein L11 methyltransferase [Candidatus Woesearchaeota archaeon]